MPNRFTAQFDALVADSQDEYIFWMDIMIIHKDFEVHLFNFAAANGLNNQKLESNSFKVLALCFLAEMSDEDLKECFGV